MRVLFVTKSEWWDQPAIFLLTRVLREQGYIVDAIFEDMDDIDDYVSTTHVDACLYSIMSPAYRWFRETNDRLKARYDFKTIVGGAHFTLDPDSGAQDQNVDHVVIGPGEAVIVDILERRIRDKVVTGTMTDITSWYDMDRSVLYDKYLLIRNSPLKAFITSRYCPESCTYCANQQYRRIFCKQKDLLQQRVPPERLINDIMNVRNRYGLKFIHFLDDDFCLDASWVARFCSLYDNVRIPFSVVVRMQSIDALLVERLASVGNTLIYLSLESANESTRRFLGRPRITNSEISEKIKIVNWSGTKVRLSSIIGIPVGDPRKDAIDTLAFNQAHDIYMPTASILQPYPGTAIRTWCEKRGLIEKDADTYHLRSKPSIKLQDPDFYTRLVSMWYVFAKYRIPVDWVEFVLSLPSWPTDQIQRELDKRFNDLRLAAVEQRVASFE